MVPITVKVLICQSTCILYMKGPYDDMLYRPLKGKYIVTLLNQVSNINHHSVIELQLLVVGVIVTMIVAMMTLV